MFSLVSRNNQDGIFKSNTTLQLAERIITIITDRNSKEHPQSEVDQKELSQVIKYFSPFTQIETKLWTKSTWKPKNKECQEGVI